MLFDEIFVSFFIILFNEILHFKSQNGEKEMERNLVYFKTMSIIGYEISMVENIIP